MLLSIILMTGGEQGQGGGIGSMLLPILLMIVVFYFFMIRPQARRAKEQKKYREELSKGDKVVTVGGVHGKIVDMDETTVILEMIDKSRMKVEKASISVESTMALANREGRKDSAKEGKKEDKTSESI